MTTPPDRRTFPTGHPAPRPRKTFRRRAPREGVHYLTFSCCKRLPLLGKPAIRDAFVAALTHARQVHRFKLIAWVVMPEHVHIILVPTARASQDDLRGSALPSILIGLKKPFAALMLARWRAARWDGLKPITDARGRAHFWQPGGGFDRNVRDLDELMREIAYIHRNPVKRGLVEKPEQWAWSSARRYLGWSDALGPPIDTIRISGREWPDVSAGSGVGSG